MSNIKDGVMHLSVAPDGLVSLWDTKLAAKQGMAENERYVPLRLTWFQLEYLDIPKPPRRWVIRLRDFYYAGFSEELNDALFAPQAERASFETEQDARNRALSIPGSVVEEAPAR
jgi:hypothetical protein